MAFRQVSWLDPISSDEAFSRISAQGRINHRFGGLTVAVTTRDSHPLPYSLAASVRSRLSRYGKCRSKHLKVMTKIFGRLPFTDDCRSRTIAVNARAKASTRVEPSQLKREPGIKSLEPWPAKV